MTITADMQTAIGKSPHRDSLGDGRHHFRPLHLDANEIPAVA